MQLELVRRARSGDEEAFEGLVRAATPRLLGAARLILRDPDRAQDAVQDALVLAWRNMRALRDAEAWDVWLYRLTTRACVQAAKSSRRRDVAEIHVDPGERAAVSADFSTSLAERDRLSRELGRLGADQRTVLVLHFYLDLPISVIADVLEIPVGTAKSRLNRGLSTMRSALERERPGLHVVEERPA
jgi:RNA polymerase sigma-70 factor (ECF subfamily)